MGFKNSYRNADGSYSTYNKDGSITNSYKNADGSYSTYNRDGSITNSYKNADGSYSTYNRDGSITNHYRNADGSYSTYNRDGSITNHYRNADGSFTTYERDSYNSGSYGGGYSSGAYSRYSYVPRKPKYPFLEKLADFCSKISVIFAVISFVLAFFYSKIDIKIYKLIYDVIYFSSFIFTFIISSCDDPELIELIVITGFPLLFSAFIRNTLLYDILGHSKSVAMGLWRNVFISLVIYILIIIIGSAFRSLIVVDKNTNTKKILNNFIFSIDIFYVLLLALYSFISYKYNYDCLNAKSIIFLIIQTSRIILLFVFSSLKSKDKKVARCIVAIIFALLGITSLLIDKFSFLELIKFKGIEYFFLIAYAILGIVNNEQINKVARYFVALPSVLLIINHLEILSPDYFLHNKVIAIYLLGIIWLACLLVATNLELVRKEN